MVNPLNNDIPRSVCYQTDYKYKGGNRVRSCVRCRCKFIGGSWRLFCKKCANESKLSLNVDKDTKPCVLTNKELIEKCVAAVQSLTENVEYERNHIPNENSDPELLILELIQRFSTIKNLSNIELWKKTR